MAEVSFDEASAQLPSLIDKVERGEEVVIIRHGRPVARLVAAEAARPSAGDDLVERFREARKGLRLDGLSIKDLINEGRR